MSKAEDLLYSLEASEVMTLSASSSEEPHIIIGADRYITVPDELKRLAVQYDHDIETVTFDCPRYWDEHDMSQMSVYINYVLSDQTPGAYKAQNVRVDDTDLSIMHFEWTINSDVTGVSGNINFLVCVKNIDDYGVEKNHWNTEICKDCYISAGMEHDDVFIFDPDNPYAKVFEEFAYIGTNEPTTIPAIWFDPYGDSVTVNTQSSGSAEVSAYAKVLEDFIYIGNDIPPSLPVLWVYPYDSSVIEDDYVNVGIVDITITEV